MAGPPPTARTEHRTATYVGVGCFTAFAGWWSGGMVAVLVAKIVGAIQGCPAGEHGQPCNWWWYALAGAVLGAVSLPVLALRRLRRDDAAGQFESQVETQSEG
jgi:hypothetical protein